MNRYFWKLWKLIYPCLFHALSADFTEVLYRTFWQILAIWGSYNCVWCHSLSWSSPSVLGVHGKLLIVDGMQSDLWGGAEPAVQAGGALMKTRNKAYFLQDRKNTNQKKVPPFPLYSTHQKRHITSTINPSISQECLGVYLGNFSGPKPNYWLDAQLNPAHSPALEEFPISFRFFLGAWELKDLPERSF